MNVKSSERISGDVNLYEKNIAKNCLTTCKSNTCNMYRSKCQLPVREMMCIDDSPCALDISHVNEVYTPFLVCSCFFTLFFKVSVKAFLGLLLRTIWAVHMSYKNKGSITRSRQYLGKLLSCSGNDVRRTNECTASTTASPNQTWPIRIHHNDNIHETIFPRVGTGPGLDLRDIPPGRTWPKKSH